MLKTFDLNEKKKLSCSRVQQLQTRKKLSCSSIVYDFQILQFGVILSFNIKGSLHNTNPRQVSSGFRFKLLGI